MEEELILTAGKEDEGARLDKYLAAVCQGYSRSYLQKLLKDGMVSVNEKPVKSSLKLKEGDRIRIVFPEPEELDAKPEKMELDILYEDSDVILVNKPKGMVVHPSQGHPSHTLVNGLLYHCAGELSGINGVLRPGIVHRIDMDTTGVLIVCKNDFAHASIAQQLKVHSITRKYRAVVYGVLRQDEGRIDAPIGRSPKDRMKMAVNDKNGKPAVTHYQVLERFNGYTYIECQLETGRTHQIRVHMASIGHPLLGDPLYGPAKTPSKPMFSNLQGQTLHAMVFGFVHPRTGEYMEFTAPLPQYFQNLLEKLKKA